MQEVAFLRQNAEKWKQLEEALKAPRQVEPDVLAELFVEVTDDLSYARTFYPDSKTTHYLNGLAADVHRAIYRNKKEDRRRFVTFWTREVPQAVREARTELLLALGIFVVALLIGTISAANDAGFIRLILGDRYVNMTLENIANDDPLAVYKGMHQADMFFGIAVNNIRVAFTAFAMGLLASFGTGYILLQNGIMLGSFHHLFYEHDLLLEALLVIYIHGTLEISAIIIAGGAGLVLGNSLLFPGTYSRLESFMRGAKRGVRIVVGLVPVFLLAALFEGFVTRYTEMPLALSLLIIGGSLAFILWYFVWLPYHLPPVPTDGSRIRNQAA
jgi:uncharacterized membrane protein SpoIIM required for sporulation